MAQVILVSGGMDSLISHRLFYPDAQPVFVWTGSRYQHLDHGYAAQQVPHLFEISTGDLREWRNGVVPHRNAILLAQVANMFDATEIIVSAPRGELIHDQQPKFHRDMERVLPGVRITNPLRKLTKTQAVRLWLRRGLPARELLASRSCYGTMRSQCGQCSACVKRWVALTNNYLAEQYRSDVREHARQLAKLGDMRTALKYGWRPLWEAWAAFNK